MTIIVLVDVEARGASPINGTLTEFGAVALNSNMTAVQDTFHGKLVEAVPDPSNPAIPFIPEGAKRYDGRKIAEKFTLWLKGFGDRVVFVSDNPAYDYMWMAAFFDSHNMSNPFGHSARRIGDFAAGLTSTWGNTNKWKRLRDTKHTHNPVDDSMGNAEALIKLIAMSRGGEKVI